MSTDLHTLSGAYAIDALSPGEADSFERHLDECPACRDEVRELQAVAARMGASEAIAPPSALRSRVLEAADRQPQLPPKVTSLAERRQRRVPRLVGAAAAVILLAGAVAGVVTRPWEQHSAQVSANPVSEVFDAPDAHVSTIKTADGHRLRLATSLYSGRMALETDTLRRLKHKEVYQMWAKHNGRVTSIGVVQDLEQGKVIPIPTYGTTIAITVEPEGGSRRPTSAPITKWMDPQAI